jgi:4-amino-4-deoxy-L-arabinose transferase-like glycosyltransferase
LKQFDDYAEGNDIAIRDGVLYSDRPPGTAVFATLFYRAATLLPTPLAPLPSRHDADNPHLPTVMLVPVLAGAGTIVLLYWLLRRWDVKEGAALTAVLMFALGTVHWKYSTVLFSHALSGFLVVLSIFLAIRMNAKSKWTAYFWLGFVLGYAVLVEYSNGLLVVVMGAVMLGKIRPFTPQTLTRTLLPFIAGGLIPALFLAYYNNTNFGSPFTLSYAYAVNYPWAGEFRTTFNYPLGQGLQSLLWFGTGDGQCDPACFNQGFLLLSPVLLLAVPGLGLYVRRARWEAVWVTAVFLIYLLLFAKHRTSHGFTADGRYLLPFLTLLTLPLGFTVQWVHQQFNAHPIRYASLNLILYGLFFLSLHNIMLHIGFSYNYNLDLTQLSQIVASPQNWRYLSHELLRNTRNLPLLWLVEGVGLLILWGYFVIKRRNYVIT